MFAQTKPAHMKSLFTLVAGTAAFSTFAQMGVLNSNEMAPVGSVFTYQTAVNLDVLDTTTGANVNWNVTGLLPTTQTPWDVDYLAPATSPHPTAFPTANYCTFESEIPRYNYYTLNSTAMDKVGSWTTSQVSYSDYQREYVFPLQLGTTNLDTWANTSSTFGGTYSITCIGSGSLNLPVGTFNDVLLVRVKGYDILTIVQYLWVDATNGAPLLIYFPGDDFFIPEAAAYAVNTAIGIEENVQTTELRLHGVVNDELMVSYASLTPLTLYVRSATGQLVRTVEWPASPTPSTRGVDAAGLASGVYILQVQGADGTVQAAKFYKP